MTIREYIDEALEGCLTGIYIEKGITRGDILPLQLRKWNEIVDMATVLFNNLIKLNEEL